MKNVMMGITFYLPVFRRDSRIWPILFFLDQQRTGFSRKLVPASTTGLVKTLCGFFLACGKVEGTLVSVDLEWKKISLE